MRAALLALVLLAAPALAQPQPEPGGMIHTAEVSFVPTNTTANATSTVIVMNFDPTKHSVTADDGSFDVDVPVTQIGEIAAQFNAPKTNGTYAFHCRYHAQMKGALIVENGEPAKPKETPFAGALLVALSAVALALLLRPPTRRPRG